MPSAAIIKPFPTTATRHKRNRTINKMTTLLSITGTSETMSSPLISPVDKASAKTSRCIPGGLLWKVLDDARPSSCPKCRGQNRECRLSEEGEQVLPLRINANIAKAQFPKSSCLPVNLPALSAYLLPMSTLVWIIYQALAVSIPYMAVYASQN